MNDIKIPVSGSSPAGKKPEFEVKHVGASDEGGARGYEPSEKVKVKFEKFVQLVATHNFEEVMKRHAEDDVILSTNLLADLANAHEEMPEESRSKMPVIFVVGILLGVVITYLVVRF